MSISIRSCLAACLVLSVAACRDQAASQHHAVALSTEEAGDLLINRNWMDLWPESESEKLAVFRFVPDMGGGVFQDRTLFQGSFELFSFKVSGDVIKFNLHHKKQKVPSHFRIERVDGPRPFDLKLTLDPSPRGPKVYYGRSSETATDLGLHPIE